jgi:hypothetical protein
MRAPYEILEQVNQTASDYAGLLGGVQEDGYIDMEEAILGSDYAEEYRKNLMALRRETQAAIKETRAAYRERMRELRANAMTIARGREAANELATEQIDVLKPYYDTLIRLAQLIAEAKLSKSVFHAAAEKLRQTNTDAILIPQFTEISAATHVEDDDDDVDDQPGQDALAAQVLEDEVEGLSESIREVAVRWQTLLSEAADRLTLDLHPKQASHLRGIQKALQLAIDDVSSLIVPAGQA